MENTEPWVLCPHRCESCNHATYLRECWRDSSGKVDRRLRHEPQPRLISVQGVQPGNGFDVGGLSVAVLPTSGGISYCVRGHGVTITVSGDADDVHNIVRVANDVVEHPVIQGDRKSVV